MQFFQDVNGTVAVAEAIRVTGISRDQFKTLQRRGQLPFEREVRGRLSIDQAAALGRAAEISRELKIPMPSACEIVRKNVPLEPAIEPPIASSEGPRAFRISAAVTVALAAIAKTELVDADGWLWLEVTLHNGIRVASESLVPDQPPPFVDPRELKAAIDAALGLPAEV